MSSESISDASALNISIDEISSSRQLTSTVEGRTWFAEHPKTAIALKYLLIGSIALLIIGSLVGIGVSGGFGPDGWLQQTALPAIKKFFQDIWHWIVNTALPAIREFLDWIPDLNVGQGLAYIAAPIVGLMLLGGLGYKYAVPYLKEKYDACKAEREEAHRVELKKQADYDEYSKLIEANKN